MHHLARERRVPRVDEPPAPLRREPAPEAVLYSTGNLPRSSNCRGRRFHKQPARLDTAIALPTTEGAGGGGDHTGNPAARKPRGPLGPTRGRCAIPRRLRRRPGFTVPVDAPTAGTHRPVLGVVAATSTTPRRAPTAAKEKLTVLGASPVTDPPAVGIPPVSRGSPQQKDGLAGLGKNGGQPAPADRVRSGATRFANRVVKHVRSNAIVIAKDGNCWGSAPGRCRGSSRAGSFSTGAAARARAGRRGPRLRRFFPSATPRTRGGGRADRFVEPGPEARRGVGRRGRRRRGRWFTGTRHFRH